MLGVPDRFIPHGSREQLLTMLRLDAVSIAEDLTRYIEERKQ